MPQALRLFETAFYSLDNLIPYLMLSLYPYKDNYRFKKRIIWLIIFIIAIIQIFIGIWATFFPQTPSIVKSFASTGIYIIFYFAAVKDNLGKMVFTLLMLSNISNLIVITSKCIEGIIFPDMAIQSYRWTFTSIMIIVQIMFLIPVYLYFKKIYIPAIKGETGQAIWRYMWIIPLTFYVLWCYIIYNNPISALEIALMPQNTVFLLLINIGAFIVYNAVISLSIEQQKNLELKTQNHMLEIQTLEYSKFTGKLSEIKRINHDIRHNVILMSEYLKNKKYDELESFFAEYLRTIPDNTFVYCSNQSLNMLISYFAQISKQEGIDFKCDVRITDKLLMSDSDLSVLVGNLLENAVEACRRILTDNKTITIRGKIENNNIMLITVDNTYINEPQKGSDGIFNSSKHTGAGIGVESVKNIAEKYNGKCRFETADGIFMASVMLNI